MKGHLLDVNVLLALGWPNHVHHDLAHQWFHQNRAKGWATCALTQLSFVRLSSNPRICPSPQTPQLAIAWLVQFTKLSHHMYWQEKAGGLAADGLASVFDTVGHHEQVTDAFLVSIAEFNEGKVATFDLSLSRRFPSVVDLIKVGTAV